VELLCEAGHAKRNAEKVNGIASPGQPAWKIGCGKRIGRTAETGEGSPREEQERLGRRETGQNTQEWPGNLTLFAVGYEIA